MSIKRENLLAEKRTHQLSSACVALRMDDVTRMGGIVISHALQQVRDRQRIYSSRSYRQFAPSPLGVTVCYYFRSCQPLRESNVAVVNRKLSVTCLSLNSEQKWKWTAWCCRLWCTAMIAVTSTFTRRWRLISRRRPSTAALATFLR